MTAETTATHWAVDPAHSQVQFKVKHLAIASVAGTFNIFHGDVVTNGDDFDGAKINFEIDANSIYTNHAERDGHLKSELFFDTTNHPQITFTGQLQKDGDKHRLMGDLSIRGITKSVILEAEFTGVGKGRFGDTRAGFELNGKINRKDFGLTFNMLTETGGLVVGEEIKLHFDVELIRK